MKIIGLTGGIGSGKSTVAQFFAAHGIPVYYADEAGREVLKKPEVVSQISSVFGNDVLVEGSVDRTRLAEIVFKDPARLEILNSIVHPAVRDDFTQWKKRHHKEAVVIREAAILFESGSYKDCDKIILVSAPEEIRIKRVMERDGASRDQVLARMANQWDDDQKLELSDFHVINIDIVQTKIQCEEILKKLKNL